MNLDRESVDKKLVKQRLRRLSPILVVGLLLATTCVLVAMKLRLNWGPNGHRRIFHPRSLLFEDYELYAFPFTRWVFRATPMREGEHPVRHAAIKAGLALDDSSTLTNVASESIGGEVHWTDESWGYHSTVCAKCGYGDMVDELLRQMDRAETSVAARPFLKRFVEALQAEDYREADKVIGEAGKSLHISKR